MAQVSLKINGYAYTVGCEDGQEDHLRAMAGAVEERMARIKALGSQSGESRLLVLAALLMADELHDMAAELADAQNRAKPCCRPPWSQGAWRSSQSGRKALRRRWSGPKYRSGAARCVRHFTPRANKHSPGSWRCCDRGHGTRRPPAQAGLGRVRRQRPGRLHPMHCQACWPLSPRERAGVREAGQRAPGAPPRTRRSAHGWRNMSYATPRLSPASPSPGSGRRGGRLMSAPCCTPCIRGATLSCCLSPRPAASL